MLAIVSPGTISGAVTPPPSKSIMQRACAAALLHKGTTIIHNPGTSADDKAALDIIQQLGATVTYNGDAITITSNGVQPISNTIDCGESGLSARLFTSIAALAEQPITITGHGSVLKRPMLFFEHILSELGAEVSSNNSYLPITVKGPLRIEDIVIDGKASSQYLSSLLFAYCYTTQPQTVKITVEELNSKPYADLTIEMLQHFGAILLHQDHKTFAIKNGITHGNEVAVTIEADWSAAANWIAASAIAGVVTINNLNLQSLQADREIIKVVNTEKTAFDFDATDCPDIIPILSVYAACCNSTCTIKGLHRLIHKESNRVESTTAMLQALGVSFSIDDDTITITPVDRFNNCTVNGYNDHRIVMAASVAALNATGDVTITCAEAVSKSYPDFFSHLSSLGAKCILKDE